MCCTPLRRIVAQSTALCAARVAIPLLFHKIFVISDTRDLKFPSDLGKCNKSCIFAIAMVYVVANDILIPEIAQMLAEGREVRFTPNGISMRPWIEGGRDSVVLRRLLRRQEWGI